MKLSKLKLKIHFIGYYKLLSLWDQVNHIIYSLRRFHNHNFNYTHTIVDILWFNRIRKSNVLDLDPENGSCGQEEQLFYNENNEQLWNCDENILNSGMTFIAAGLNLEAI